MARDGELDLDDLRRRAVMAGDSTVGRDLRALVAEVDRLTAERDVAEQTVPELLGGYARTLAELRRRGVVRSANAPAGDYAEWLVAKALGGDLAFDSSMKSWDVRLPTGDRVQVKTRLVSVPPRAGQLQTSPFRSWDFETTALVLLASEDYRVVRGVLVPATVVRGHGRWRAHVNGHVVMINRALLDHPSATDITERLRRGAEIEG